MNTVRLWGAKMISKLIKVKGSNVTLADLFDLGFNYKELKQLGYRFRMAV
jgi:hypothetical protein